MTTTNLKSVNRSVVVVLRGSVVNTRFDEHLPSIYSVLHAEEGECIVIEVLAPRDAHYVRSIALAPTQGLSCGVRVEDTGGPLKGQGRASTFRRVDTVLTQFATESQFLDACENATDWIHVNFA